MQACREVWYGNGDMRGMPHLGAKLRRPPVILLALWIIGTLDETE